MLLPTINTADGKAMSALDVDPANLPRNFDLIDMGEGLATWRVDGIVWAEHPERLQPKAVRLTCVETRQ